MRRALLAGGIGVALAGTAWATGYQDFNAGVAAWVRDDWGNAVASLSRALAEPDLPAHLKSIAYFDRGTAYLRQEKYELAIADFTAAIARDPNDIRAYASRAIAADLAGRHEQALADLASAIRLRPYFAQHYFQRMAIYEELGRYADVLAESNRLLQLWPSDPEVYIARSDAYVSLGRYDLAMADLNGAIGLDEKSDDAFLARSRLHALKGELDDALDDIDRAADVGLDKASADSDRGFVQWEMGHFDRAEKSFRRALDEDPSFNLARLGLVISLIKSRAWSAESLAKDLSNADLTSWPGPIIALYLGKTSPDALLSEAKKGDLPELSDQGCQAHFYLGEWQLARADSAAARASLEEAVKTCLSDQNTLAAARAEMGRVPVPESKT